MKTLPQNTVSKLVIVLDNTQLSSYRS